MALSDWMDPMDLLYGFIGGIMIGLAASIPILLAGEIMGCTNIISTTVLEPRKALTDPKQHWKIVILSSFLLFSWAVLKPNVDVPLVNSVGRSTAAHVLSGLLVGFGTKLGNGCTSGHGICGMCRLSKRSIVFIMVFMVAALIMTPINNYLSIFSFLFTDEGLDDDTTYDTAAAVVTFTVVALAVLATFFYTKSQENEGMYKIIVTIVSGCLFAGGLFVGQMIYPSKILDFLDLSKIVTGGYDPTLIMVLGGGCGVSFMGYQFVEGHRLIKHCWTVHKPLALGPEGRFNIPTNNTTIDWQLILGATLFGIGWSFAGLCIAPALLLAVGIPQVLVIWWPMFFVGAFLAQLVKKWAEKKNEGNVTESSQPGSTAMDNATDNKNEIQSCTQEDTTVQPMDLSS